MELAVSTHSRPTSSRCYKAQPFFFVFLCFRIHDISISQLITMASSRYEKERRVAEDTVLRAARLTKEVQATVTEMSKADSSPVTVADFAAQALMISLLEAEFPNDLFVGEEGADALRADARLCEKVYALFCKHHPSPPSQDAMLRLIDAGGNGTGGPHGRFWVMDPVDGTATFLTGEQYAVSLALLEDGHEVVGAVAYPNVSDGRIEEAKIGTGAMMAATKGQGAQITWFGGKSAELDRLEVGGGPLHVVDCARNRPSHRDVMRRVAEKLGAPFPGTDVWSSHVRYAALVFGGGDFLVRIPAGEDSLSCIWDHAGAHLIYNEVGGRVTDLDGKAVDFAAGRYLARNRGLVFAKEDIHEKVLAAVREHVTGEYLE